MPLPIATAFMKSIGDESLASGDYGHRRRMGRKKEWGNDQRKERNIVKENEKEIRNWGKVVKRARHLSPASTGPQKGRTISLIS